MYEHRTTEHSICHIILQPPVTKITIRWSWWPGCWKMTAVYSICTEMCVELLLHWICNVQRSAIFQKYYAPNTQNDIVVERRGRAKQFLTVYHWQFWYQNSQNLSPGTEWSCDKWYHKPAPHSCLCRMNRHCCMCEENFRCPYSELFFIDMPLENGLRVF